MVNLWNIWEQCLVCGSIAEDKRETGKMYVGNQKDCQGSQEEDMGERAQQQGWKMASSENTLCSWLSSDTLLVWTPRLCSYPPGTGCRLPETLTWGLKFLVIWDWAASWAGRGDDFWWSLDPPLSPSKHASSIWVNELCLLINGSYLARALLNCQDFKLT